MKLSFDYYHNLEKIDFYLCNPDGRELFVLPARERHATLRFNDLSELTFVVDDKTTLSNLEVIGLEAYDYVRTKRLIYATDVGWFCITNVDEQDNGVVRCKKVTAKSYQMCLGDKGFLSEERVYCFYNENDPYDDRYSSSNEGNVPSVVGQWHRQLGIDAALTQGLDEPSVPFDNWTVTYISDSIKNLHRSFKSTSSNGYEWIAKDVEDAFECVVLFDNLYKTIRVMTVAEVTSEKANVIYTFGNFMKEVNVSEDSGDIVTVLNCNGSNCDITMVNPTGTNYICDFSYYMDEVKHRWMSDELIQAIKEWQIACGAEKDKYAEHVAAYRALAEQENSCDTMLRESSLRLTDLKNARDRRSVLGEGDEGKICGYVTSERVDVGGTSLDVRSAYRTSAFTGSSRVTAYNVAPTYNPDTKLYEFSGSSTTGTADAIVAANFEDDATIQYWYFADGDGYCKLDSKAIVNAEAVNANYCCGGFERFIVMTYPVIEMVHNQEDGTATKVVAYTDSLQNWINLHEGRVASLNAQNKSIKVQMASHNLVLGDISSRLNILSYFSSRPDLLRELNCYWVEGDYTNENITVQDGMTVAQEIDLANELMASGYLELKKVSQPRFSFSLDAIDATKNYEFREQMSELELGKIITIEKDEGLWYYPALLEISMNLDDVEEFSMSFANALRLDDWGYTYADMISDSSSTSRQVSANWQNITSYAKDRDNIRSVIQNPLDLSLRAAYANTTNQEFFIGEMGILGRKRTSNGEAESLGGKRTSGTESEFEDEQVRLINNVLIFTDDNWNTAKTALGKISLPDPDNETKTISKYGLAAEVIFGELFIGEALKIRNPDSTIAIDKNGISVMRATSNEPGSETEEDRIIFRVNTKGELILKGYALAKDMSESLAWLQTHVEDNYATASMLTQVESDVASALAEFKAEATDMYVTTEQLSSFETETSKSISDVVTYVEDNYATTAMLSRVETDAERALAEFRTEVTNTYATTSQVSELETETSDNFAQVYTHVSDNYATTSMLAQVESNAASALGEFKVEVTDTYVSSEQLSLFESETSKSIANVKTYVEENYATTSMLSQVESDAADALSEFKTEASNTYAKATLETSFNNRMASLQELVDANSAALLAKVSNTFTGNSFGWSLTESGFELLSNGRTVFSCDSGGITVNGYVTAQNFNLLSGKVATVSETVGEVQESIDWVIEQLDLKLNESDYNDYIDRLDEYETRITANAEGLASKVSQTTFENMGTRVSQCESTIIQQANLISAKVDSYGSNEDVFFWWSLDKYGFYLGNESEELMAVTDNGLYVTGEVVATKGSFQNGTFNNCIISEDCTINGTLTSDNICSHSYGVTSGSLDFVDGKYEWSLWSGSESASIELNLRDYGYAAIELSVPGGSFFLGSGGTIQLEGSSIAFTGDTTTLTSDSFSVYTKEWNCNSLPVVSSDSRLKNSIAHFDDQYEVFFDSLVPVRYRYNDGTSNRYHSGFIAQEVDNAISESGLTRGDFAGLCIHAEGTAEERWGLRYGEFVSINTWQIQKLKARVTELENYIKSMSKQ